MAESNKSEEGESWWSSWIQSAKEKSSTTLEFMKRDLAEFTHTVHTDAAAAVYNSASLLKEKLKVDSSDSVVNRARQGLNTVLNTITEVFSPIRELDNDEVLIIHNSEPVMLDRWEAQLYAVRTDPNTYCHEPEGPPELYESWLEVFILDDHEEEMSDIMVNYSDVRKLYAKLVPAAVSHVEFWQRYFYKIYQLRENEARIAELMRRTDLRSPPKDFEWDEDDDDLPSKNSRISLNQNHTSFNEPDSDQSAVSQLCSGNTSAVEKIMARNTENSIINKVGTDKESKNTCQFLTHPLNNELNFSNETVTNNKKKELIIQQSQEENCISSQIIPLKTCVTTSCDGASQSDKQGKLEVISGSKITCNDASPASSVSGSKADGSTEDEWEKDFDLEVNEKDLKTSEIDNKNQSESLITSEVEEDWEKWSE